MFVRTNLLALLFFLFVCALGVVVGCGERPVAVVNTHRVTETEFISRLKELSGKQVLADIIDRQIIEDAFVKAGLQISEEEVGVELQKMQDRFPTPEAFDQELARAGSTREDLQKNLEFSMKVEKLRTKDVEVTEEKLQQFYQEYRARYDKPLRVNIREIVTMSRKHAEDALAALREPGASFAAVIEQQSVAPSRQYGGQRPLTPIDDLWPMELRNASKTAAVGDIVGPIETDQGWYIVEIEERKPAEKATFETAREQVVQEYKGARAPSPEALVMQLRQEALVKIVVPDFQELSQLYAGPQQLPEFGEGSEQREGTPAEETIPTEESETPQPAESEGD